MNSKDITKLLIGQKVTVKSENIYDKRIRGIRGKIINFDPEEKIKLKVNEHHTETIYFGDHEEGIHKIIGYGKTIFYQNKAVLNRYIPGKPLEIEEYQEILKEGEFFPEQN